MLINRWHKQAVLACAVLAGAAMAQAQGSDTETLLKGKQVTKEALIQALQTDTADADAPADADAMGGIKTRGFKLATATSPSAKPRKASLLITFAVDSAKLTRESKGMLDVMADAMQSKTLAGSSFAIEGHADPRGDEGHNLALSQQRAESVLAYLVEHRGLAKESLTAKGKGSSELRNPQQPNAAENRRVTFVNLN